VTKLAFEIIQEISVLRINVTYPNLAQKHTRIASSSRLHPPIELEACEMKTSTWRVTFTFRDGSMVADTTRKKSTRTQR